MLIDKNIATQPDSASEAISGSPYIPLTKGDIGGLHYDSVDTLVLPS